MDGILLVSYIRKNMAEGLVRDEAIILAGETRMRQIFMTGLSASRTWEVARGPMRGTPLARRTIIVHESP
jgi:hypothetical protein